MTGWNRLQRRLRTVFAAYTGEPERRLSGEKPQVRTTGAEGAHGTPYADRGADACAWRSFCSSSQP